MGLKRNISNIRRRLNKVVPQVQTPQLKLTVIGASYPVLAHAVWEMVIRVEDKDPAYNKLKKKVDRHSTVVLPGIFPSHPR